MMFERKMQVIPGWDDIYDTCKHAHPGDHGIHADGALYWVATESPDGRRVALSLEVGSDRYPATIPVAHFRYGPNHPTKPCDLSLHVQPLAGTKGRPGCIALHGGECISTYTTALGADEFYKAHGNPANAFEQSEGFWCALEQRLAHFIDRGSHFPSEDEMSVDGMVDAIEGRSYARKTGPIMIARWGRRSSIRGLHCRCRHRSGRPTYRGHLRGVPAVRRRRQEPPLMADPRADPDHRILHTGEGRVVVAFSVPELVEISLSVVDDDVANRCLCAIGLLDADLEAGLRKERATIYGTDDEPTTDR